jgi:hypothetical protein
LAISRRQRSRWPWVVAALIAGLAIGLLIGLAAGGGDGESAEDSLRDMRSSLDEAANLLDIMKVEYAESVKGGQVVSKPEYRGAGSALERSQAEYRDAREALVLANAPAVQLLDTGYRDLNRLVTERAAPARVAAVATAVARNIGRVTGSSA